MIEMADDIRIVKISYKNLQDIASKCEETDTRHDGEGGREGGSQGKDRRKSKRPAIEIYQPGRGIRKAAQSTKPVSSNNEQNETDLKNTDNEGGNNLQTEKNRDVPVNNFELSDKQKGKSSLDKQTGKQVGNTESDLANKVSRMQIDTQRDAKVSQEFEQNVVEAGSKRRSKKSDVSVYVPRPRSEKNNEPFNVQSKSTDEPVKTMVFENSKTKVCTPLPSSKENKKETERRTVAITDKKEDIRVTISNRHTSEPMYSGDNSTGSLLDLQPSVESRSKRYFAKSRSARKNRGSQEDSEMESPSRNKNRPEYPESSYQVTKSDQNQMKNKAKKPQKEMNKNKDRENASFSTDGSKKDNFQKVKSDRHHLDSAEDLSNQDIQGNRSYMHRNDSGDKRSGRKRYNSDGANYQTKGNQKGHVTFAPEKQVRKFERTPLYDSDSDDERPTNTAKGGGILRLPLSSGVVAPQSANFENSQSADFPSVPQRKQMQSSRGRGRGNRTLFDPKNPNKPIQIEIDNSAEPNFQDPCNRMSSSPNICPNSSHYDYGDYYQKYNYNNYGVDYSGNPAGDGHYSNVYPTQAFPYYDSGAYHDDTYTRDPYYHSGYESVSSGRSRSENRMKAERHLMDVAPIQSQILNLLSRRIQGNEAFEKMNRMRHEVQFHFSEVILLEPDLANRHNVEQNLWKAAYYHAIEILRRQLQEEEDSDVKQQLLSILDEGTSFYNELLKKMQQTFKFDLSDFLDTHTLQPENISRNVKLALLSAQRCMICLGDVARYREQANETSNYGRARSWYMKAQQLAPKNGRPYNQLAILALYTRRKLDAVYNYMRSLSASNPFLTARESLMSLFDEARKKAEVTEKKRLEEKARLERKNKFKQKQHRDGHRVEIWIAPDGTSTEDKIDDDIDDLTKLSAIQLNKRFSLSFLNAHGKLFTKTGMEYFPEVCSQMLHEFKVLLQHSPVPVGDGRLLQLVVICMFAVENTTLKEESLQAGCRSLLQEQAVQLGLDMFGVIVGRCVELLKDHLSSSQYPAKLLSEDLHQLFPSVKVWTDWMECHSTLWNPPPMQRDPELGPDIDVWQSVADLCNILKEIDVSHINLYKKKIDGCEPLVLDENVMLAGFVPLLSMPIDQKYVHHTTDKEIAKDSERIEKFCLFTEYLCGIEPPLLHYDVALKKYVSVAPMMSEETGKQYKNGQEISESEESDVVVESNDDEENNSGDEEHIRQLKARKEELRKKVEENQKQQENIQAVFDKESRFIELEVCPIFLVPDTNCFIDNLDAIKNIVDAKKFTLVVPLVVINELDGLAKGNKQEHYESAEHAIEVKRGAKDSVEYLEGEFEKGNRHLRALTSKGTVMDTISFRSEETSQIGNNDDLILSCCLHYCQDKARDFMPKDKGTPIRLFRDVVLLTDDRNLRLKAHTRNVPVKDIAEFVKWSKIG